MGYITKIRQRLGQDSFIHPAARILIENENGDFLFIKRNDNGNLGIPAGAFEEKETIEACIKREVLEETGLIINSLKVIGISSNPARESVSYPNGDKIQYFTIEFYSDDWRGSININDEKEVQSVSFESKEKASALPENEKSIFESLKYYRKNKQVLLK